MATFLKILFVLAAVLSFARASCIKGGAEEKEDKNVTKAGTDDVLKSGMHLKIEISLIYRKRGCMKCLLESMPKLNGILITYIRGAILLRVVHRAIVRLTLMRQSFQFVRFIRMARGQLRVLARMKWAVRLIRTLKIIDYLALAVIRFVQGHITAHKYILIYRKFLYKIYTTVSRLLLTALARWKKSPKDLSKQRKSLYGLMMLTHLLWTERFLFERLINYEGKSSVEHDRDEMINKMKGFFVETKITFRFKRPPSLGASSNGYKVINGRPVREKSKPVISILKKWKKSSNKKKTSGSSLLKKWKNNSSKKKTSGSSLLKKWKSSSSCKSQPQGAFLKYPGDCSKYLRCSHGRAHEFSCGHNQRWDQRLKTCNWANQVQC